MNYYLDTEFIEDFTDCTLHIPSFTWDKRKHYINLISIGIVSEDGREYYAVNKEFDLKHVWNKYDGEELPIGMGDAPSKRYWLRENVLRPLHKDLCKNISGDMKNTDYFFDLSTFSYKSLKRLISIYGKTRAQIAKEIQFFTGGVQFNGESHIDKILLSAARRSNEERPPIFYGYYCDYDWVVFCSLFGRMLDLPNGYPMYMRDLKQMMDETGTEEWKLKPAQTNEHHALSDARWNKQLHQKIIDFNQTIVS